MQQGRFVLHQGPGLFRVAAGATSFYQEERQRQGASGEAQERHLVAQGLANQPELLDHVSQLGRRIVGSQPVDVGRRADGRVQHRAGPKDEIRPHRLERGEDVLEVDDGVHTETARQQGYLGGEFRVSERRLEGQVRALSQGPILGIAPTGLTHEPDRRSLGPFAASGAK